MAPPKNTPEVRPSWAKQVGQPHQAGIWLDCLVKLRLSENDDIEYQIRGVVDVPDMPYGDAERQYLVQVLTSAANLPTAKRYKFTLMAWERVEGGKGVQIIKANPVPIITDDDIIGDIDVTTPPEVEAQEPSAVIHKDARSGRAHGVDPAGHKNPVQSSTRTPPTLQLQILQRFTGLEFAGALIRQPITC